MHNISKYYTLVNATYKIKQNFALNFVLNIIKRALINNNTYNNNNICNNIHI